ncbi:hypothetical protein ACIPQA_16315 [Streptomyces sp. NPDC090109]|uniref:hypothetical protein n=1 Tax=Streptomyces sp. NPDC090109 TaxID=3365948 RepID=UPI00380F3EDE
MTQPTIDARTAVYHELMWPEWNSRSEAYGTSQEQAEQLLDAYRAAVLNEAADAQTQLAVADDLARRKDMAAARRQLVKELRRAAGEDR